MSKPLPDNYCRLPWAGISNDPDGRARACCIYRDFITDTDQQPLWVQKHTTYEIFHSQYMQDLRQQFRNNERPQGCATCWNDEDMGYTSKRQNYLKEGFDFFNTQADMDWEKEPDMPYEYQMIISNSCNLKCRSCDPSHSTLWQNEQLKVYNNRGYNMPYGQSGDEQGVLWKDRQDWYANLKRLEIVGGEPFYVKQWHQIWNELIDQGYAGNMALNMSTNGTIIYPDMLRKLWTNFKGFGLSLSIDGTGAQYEYLRHPGKWDRVSKIIKQYVALKDESNNKMSCQVTTTIGWQNAWYLPDIHEFFSKEAPLKVWNNIIYGPNHMALWACPDSLKQAIIKRWDEYDWKPEYREDIEGIKRYMLSQSITDQEFVKQLKELKRVDGIRDENLLTSFPDIAEHIEPYWNIDV